MLVSGWDFSVVIPEGWFRHDPDPRTREETTAQAVLQRLGKSRRKAEARRHLTEILDAFAQDADDQKALVAATLVEQVERTVVTANLMVLERSRRTTGDVKDELAALMGALSASTDEDLRPREVDLLGLPAGGAVRLHALTRIFDGGDEGVALEVVQHWVPVPDQDVVVVVSGSTPCLAQAGHLVAIFDATAESLEFLPG